MEENENEERADRFAFCDDSDDDGVNVNNVTLEKFNENLRNTTEVDEMSVAFLKAFFTCDKVFLP